MRYSTEELLTHIQQFYAKEQRAPLWHELPFSKELLRRRFGSVTDAIIAAGVPTTKRTGDDRYQSCNCCGELFKPANRKQQFCSLSCSAKKLKNLPNSENTRKQHKCSICGTFSVYSKFCSQTCRDLHTTTLFNAGKIWHRPTLKKQLNQQACSNCALSEWQGQPIALELDHIDGDASNNLPANLRILCPNCHSLTDTWRGRNMGNGRKSRGIREH